MPIYAYQCSECGTTDTEYRQIDTRDVSTPCTVNNCKGQMERNRMRECSHTDKGFHTPIVSDSLSVGADPRDIAEHKRLHPDVEITPIGQPVFHSHGERNRYLKRVGWVDKRGFG